MINRCRLLSAVLFLVVVGCIPNSQNTMDIQGHRGCRGILPENSIPAFKKAIALGVTTLELDIAISKDHKVLISHEPFMNHEIALDLTGDEITEGDEKNFNLYQMPYDSIKRYDVGSKNHPRFPKQQKIKVYKPLLSELIQMAEAMTGGSIRYNIEIKSLPAYDGVFSPKVEEFVSLVMQVIIDEGVFERTNLQSFDIRAIEEIRRQFPKMPVSLLVDEYEDIDGKLKLISYQPEIISPYFGLLTAKSVRKYQKKGMQVLPWTVNEPADIKKMISFKVDGIITDYPDVLITILEQQN